MTDGIGRLKQALSIAIGDYGHTAALRDGRVRIEGVRARFLGADDLVGAFRRMVREVAYDVCELAPTTYFATRAAGAPFRALPVFLMRRFHHGGLLCRREAGIREPRDLHGKRVGVRAYSVTSGVWTRGILASAYGVELGRVTWVVDDEDHVRTLPLPGNVVHAPADRSLAEMMCAGEIDAALAGAAGIGRAGPPRAGWEKGAAVGANGYHELFPDAARLEADWYRRTGIYPVHGLLVVKDELLERHPWLAGALMEAFAAAKGLYLRALDAGAGSSTDDRIYRSYSAFVGDPLPYGLEPNRPAIEALIEYSWAQGLIPARARIEQLFIEPRP